MLLVQGPDFKIAIRLFYWFKEETGLAQGHTVETTSGLRNGIKNFFLLFFY